MLTTSEFSIVPDGVIFSSTADPVNDGSGASSDDGSGASSDDGSGASSNDCSIVIDSASVATPIAAIITGAAGRIIEPSNLIIDAFFNIAN